MALKRNGFTSGGFFTAKNYLQAKALLIEPKKAYQGAGYKGIGTRLYVQADVTVFADEESLTSGTPTEILLGVSINGVLADELEDKIGDAYPMTLASKENKKGDKPLTVPQDVDLAVGEAIEVYYNAREAKADAEVPDFLK